MPPKPKSPTPVVAHKHKDKRANIPTEELRDFVAEDEKYHFDAVLLNYRAEPLLPFILDLNGDPRWRLFYQDKLAVVFLKNPPGR